MTARRELWTWLAVCVAGAALVLLAAGRDWFTVTYDTREVAVSAAELAPRSAPPPGRRSPRWSPSSRREACGAGSSER